MAELIAKIGVPKIKVVITLSLWSAIKMRIAGMSKKKKRKRKIKKVKINSAAYRYFIPSIKDR